MTSTKQKVLDIAMNLNRIGNWAADDFNKIYPQMIADVANNAENLMTWGNILTHRSKLINQ